MKHKDVWSEREDGTVLLNGQPYIPPFVRRLMKDASEEELLEATGRLSRYLNTLYEMFAEQQERWPTPR